MQTFSHQKEHQVAIESTPPKTGDDPLQTWLGFLEKEESIGAGFEPRAGQQVASISANEDTTIKNGALSDVFTSQKKS